MCNYKDVASKLNFMLVVLFLISACSSSSNSFQNTENEPTAEEPDEIEWELTWSDEFDYEGMPDSTKWGYETGYIRNNEKQYYTEARTENARVEEGNLIIESRKDNYNDHSYTSASMHTKDKAEWRYGKFEVRAKLPTGRGMWPAIWMLGSNIDEVGWPDCGEIDIMENVGFDPDIVHANIHTDAYNHTEGTSKGNSREVDAPYDQYHTYTVEWHETHLSFYIDGEQYFTFRKESDDTSVWPFDQDFYLIINAAIGGGWGGQEGIDDSIFPQKYFVDYVRIYKQG